MRFHRLAMIMQLITVEQQVKRSGMLAEQVGRSDQIRQFTKFGLIRIIAFDTLIKWSLVLQLLQRCFH